MTVDGWGSVSAVLALEGLFFSIGWVYLTDRLFQDFSDAAATKLSTRILFSGTLASSLTLFALLISEIANVLDQGYALPLFFHDYSFVTIHAMDVSIIHNHWQMDRSRRSLWRWHLVLSILLIVIALPVFQIYNFYRTTLRRSFLCAFRNRGSLTKMLCIALHLLHCNAY
jgi:hypothetical protein